MVNCVCENEDDVSDKMTDNMTVTMAISVMGMSSNLDLGQS